MAQAHISWSQKCEGPVSSAQSPGLSTHRALSQQATEINPTEPEKKWSRLETPWPLL